MPNYGSLPAMDEKAGGSYFPNGQLDFLDDGVPSRYRRMILMAEPWGPSSRASLIERQKNMLAQLRGMTLNIPPFSVPDRALQELATSVTIRSWGPTGCFVAGRAVFEGIKLRRL